MPELRAVGALHWLNDGGTWLDTMISRTDRTSVRLLVGAGTGVAVAALLWLVIRGDVAVGEAGLIVGFALVFSGVARLGRPTTSAS